MPDYRGSAPRNVALTVAVLGTLVAIAGTGRSWVSTSGVIVTALALAYAVAAVRPASGRPAFITDRPHHYRLGATVYRDGRQWTVARLRPSLVEPDHWVVYLTPKEAHAHG